MNPRASNFIAALLCSLCLLTGRGSNEPQTIRYSCAHDDKFTRPLREEFSQQTGIEILTKLATETVGLAKAILAEAKTPRRDLFCSICPYCRKNRFHATLFCT